MSRASLVALASVGGVVAFIGLLFVIPLLGALGGAFGGWVVGLFFTQSIPAVLAQVGITASLWKVGATLGFIGGFFRTSVTKS